MIYCFTPGFLPQFYPSFGFLPQFYPNLPSDFVSFHRISSFFQGIFSNTNLSKSTVFRDFYLKNWASGNRTHECRSQSPVPYRLAMGQTRIWFIESETTRFVNQTTPMASIRLNLLLRKRSKPRMRLNFRASREEFRCAIKREYGRSMCTLDACIQMGIYKYMWA